MIWLAGKGGCVLPSFTFNVNRLLTSDICSSIQPVGSQVQTGISLAGHHWNLWKGPNANWEVLSFVSQDGDINDFSVDLKAFFDYIVQKQGVAGTQYIQAIQAGTEPFTGSADLLTSTYSVAVNQ